MNEIERRRDGERGFTLIEVLMAGALGALLLSSLAVASGLFLDHFEETINEQELAIDHHLMLTGIVDSLSSAREAELYSANCVLWTPASGSQRDFSWSGTPGDPLYLTRGDEDPLLFVPAVENLVFTVNSEPLVNESLTTTTESLLSFEGFTGLPNDWVDITLAEGSRHGFVFRIINTEEVAEVVLTSLEARIGRCPGQTSNLRIVLTEGQDESRPRIWGGIVASCSVSYFNLPVPVEDEGVTTIAWSTFDLPEGFVVHPNRFYAILFETDGSGEGGIVRTNIVTSGTGPVNNMAYLGTDDGGATWAPDLKTDDYRNQDVPVRLTGDITYITRTVTQIVKSVDVSLEMSRGGRTVNGVARAEIRGRFFE